MNGARYWLEIQRRDGIEQRRVTPDGLVGIVDGRCPSCETSPFHVQTEPLSIHDRDTVRAGSWSVCCKEPVGYLYAKMNTLFGLEEDFAILKHGRARVY